MMVKPLAPPPKCPTCNAARSWDEAALPEVSIAVCFPCNTRREILRPPTAPAPAVAVVDQPLPTPGRVAVTALVIADLQARTARGIATYGRPLETHNGRNALRDLYEELLDACQYLRQLLAEQDDQDGAR